MRKVVLYRQQTTVVLFRPRCHNVRTMRRLTLTLQVQTEFMDGAATLIHTMHKLCFAYDTNIGYKTKPCLMRELLDLVRLDKLRMNVMR